MEYDEGDDDQNARFFMAGLGIGCKKLDAFPHVMVSTYIKRRHIFLFSVEPYKLYVMECTVADTTNFDSSTVYLIQSG